MCGYNAPILINQGYTLTFYYTGVMCAEYITGGALPAAGSWIDTKRPIPKSLAEIILLEPDPAKTGVGSVNNG
jgi:hypothetical protein